MREEMPREESDRPGSEGGKGRRVCAAFGDQMEQISRMRTG